MRHGRHEYGEARRSGARHGGGLGNDRRLGLRLERLRRGTGCRGTGRLQLGRLRIGRLDLVLWLRLRLRGSCLELSKH